MCLLVLLGNSTRVDALRAGLPSSVARVLCRGEETATAAQLLVKR